VNEALDLAEVVPAEPFETVLQAPCGATYVHLVGVDVLQGDHVTQVRDTTTRQRATNPGRGSVIVLHFWDEDGHTFDLAFRFHKGQVYVERSHCRPCPEMPPMLWRD
jgi:hypothetical protein